MSKRRVICPPARDTTPLRDRSSRASQDRHVARARRNTRSYQELMAQVETCDELKRFFKEYTGREYMYEVRRRARARLTASARS